MKRIFLSEEQLDQIQEVAGVDNVRRHYSGRCMYGAECVGVVGQEGELMRFTLAMAGVLERPNLALELVGDAMRRDNMGLDFIYYWPDIVREDGSDWVEAPGE